MTNNNNEHYEEMNQAAEPQPEAGQDRWAQYRQGYPGTGSPTQPPKKKHKGLIIFLIILAVAVALILICRMAFHSVTNSFFSTGGVVEYDYAIDTEHLAQIDIEGTISSSDGSLYQAATYNQEWLLEQLDDIEHTPANKGIILYLDTPGGSVYETDEVYLKLLEYKEETGNPVYAIMGSTCASGGYYLACAADEIYANRNTTTGSIGVTFGTFFDVSGFLADHNVHTETLTSGANKAMGSMYDPMTEEQRAIYQSILDEAYDQFTGIVAQGRNMDINRVKELADGRIYTAKQAKGAGLLDEVCSYEDAIAAICEEAGVDTDQVYEYYYYEDVSLLNRFFMLAGRSTLGNTQDQDVAAVLKLAQEAERKPYYMMGK